MNGYIFNVIIYIRYIYNMMYHKYIKYKTKYLNMKSQQSGGAVIFKQNNIDDHMMINVNDKNNIPIYEHLNLHYTLEQKNDIRFVIDNILPCIKDENGAYYGRNILYDLKAEKNEKFGLKDIGALTYGNICLYAIKIDNNMDEIRKIIDDCHNNAISDVGTPSFYITGNKNVELGVRTHRKALKSLNTTNDRWFTDYKVYFGVFDSYVDQDLILQNIEDNAKSANEDDVKSAIGDGIKSANKSEELSESKCANILSDKMFFVAYRMQKQQGGVVINKCPNKIVRVKYDEKTNKRNNALIMKGPDIVDIARDIENICNFFLPCYGDNSAGVKPIIDTNGLSAGSFGVTLEYGDFVIKVMNRYPDKNEMNEEIMEIGKKLKKLIYLQLSFKKEYGINILNDQNININNDNILMGDYIKNKIDTKWFTEVENNYRTIKLRRDIEDIGCDYDIMIDKLEKDVTDSDRLRFRKDIVDKLQKDYAYKFDYGGTVNMETLGPIIFEKYKMMIINQNLILKKFAEILELNGNNKNNDYVENIDQFGNIDESRNINSKFGPLDNKNNINYDLLIRSRQHVIELHDIIDAQNGLINLQNSILEPQRNITDELINILKIFKLPNVPDSINKVYGYICHSNFQKILDKRVDRANNPVVKLFGNKKTAAKKTKNVSNIFIRNNGLFTEKSSVVVNIDKFKLDEIYGNYAQNEQLSDNSSSIDILTSKSIFIFLQKGDGDLSNKEIYTKIKTINEKQQFILKYLSDMYTALNYLHNECNIIHNDIKSENVVYKKNDSGYLFQLIDFGVICEVESGSNVQIGSGGSGSGSDQVYDTTKYVQNTTSFRDGRTYVEPDYLTAPQVLLRDEIGGTPLYYESTMYDESISYEYDWHCAIGIMLQFLDVIHSGETGFEYTDNINNLINITYPKIKNDTNNKRSFYHNKTKININVLKELAKNIFERFVFKSQHVENNHFVEFMSDIISTVYGSDLDANKNDKFDRKKIITLLETNEHFKSHFVANVGTKTN